MRKKCNVVFCGICFMSLFLKINCAAAATKEKIENEYAFEIERYFTILNRDSIFSFIVNLYEEKSHNVLDFFKNKNKQHISISAYFINSDFKSIGVGEYEKNGGFKYQNNHSYNLKNFNGGYSYVFAFGKNSDFLLVPYLSFGFKSFSLNNFLDDVSLSPKFNVFDINGGLYTMFTFLKYESSFLFVDILLSLNFNNIKNSTYKEDAYEPVKNSVSNFDINFILGLGYKTEFEISKLFGKASFLPKISFLRVGKKMDSKNIMDKGDLKDYGGDITANYNSIYAMPSFDLTTHDMFKGIFLGNIVNTMSFKFKYLIDIASNYKNSYEVKARDIQENVLYPKAPEGFDISLGFGMDKRYFSYLISYNFNREAIVFDFNLKF